ncbi:MAG: universal stress protein, partial [Pseudomonadota bacterium]
HSDSSIVIPSEFGILVGEGAAWGTVWQNKKKPSSDAARKLFGRVASSYDLPLIKRPKSTPGAVWLEKVGSPDRVLSNIGPVSDLIVVSRPLTKGGTVARLFLTAALLNTSRPVLVLPQAKKTTVGQRISIAWNQSAEAASAVAAAMPLLQQAEEVNIITCGPEGGTGPKSTQLASYLRFWGVKAKRISSRDKDHAQAIVKMYKETKSDLLVMGAYSRGRLRQQIFGGVTEFMLRKANIPVFMLHT